MILLQKLFNKAFRINNSIVFNKLWIKNIFTNRSSIKSNIYGLFHVYSKYSFHSSGLSSASSKLTFSRFWLWNRGRHASCLLLLFSHLCIIFLPTDRRHSWATNFDVIFKNILNYLNSYFINFYVLFHMIDDILIAMMNHVWWLVTLCFYEIVSCDD